MRGSAPGNAIVYRDDTGFEARCPDCARAKRAAYWPITLEFWDPTRVNAEGGRLGRSMARCRACWQAKDARDRRRRYLRDEALRERETRRNAKYRAECGDAIRIAQRAQREGMAA